jgi:uncharacterized protein
MRLVDGRLLLSPSDLSAHLACPHLTSLQLAVQRGELARPHIDDPHAELIFAKGREHEAAYLARLEAEGRSIARMPTYDDGDAFDEDEARRLTEEAIRAGAADVVYQAYLTDGSWRGFADFLERQPDGSYEPVDTKLSRSAKPAHVLQLCFYAGELERIQGRAPEHLHVELGTGERESFRTAEYAAYYRRVRERFLAALDDPGETYPWPCDHCGTCDFRRLCRQQLVDDDNLVLVAGLGRGQAELLGGAGIPTLEALGDTPPGTAVPRVRPETFERLRHQASLQLHRRRAGEHRVDHLPLEEGRGFLALPEPSPGDVWFDMEGHPFFETARGLEYLFGYCYRDETGETRYEAIWARDRDGERQAFERFVDWVVERRSRYPGAHVYHYASYERSTLRRLMGEHGTRESEVDDFLRRDVLVDLYRVVRQALRASVESYSIKVVEELYGFERTARVHGGDESVVAFERWLESGDDALLDGIRDYNEEDCRSLAALHGWLLLRRPPDLPWRPPPDERERSAAAEEMDAERAAVRDALLAREAEEGPDWLLAQLLDYHRREAKPQWWEWFHHLGLSAEELIEDADTIGGLDLVSKRSVPYSIEYTLSFPEQEHKIGGDAVDPATGKHHPVAVDDERGLVTLRRGKNRAAEPLPRALIPGQPVPDGEQRAAVLRFARSLLAGDGRYRALEDVLRRRPPHARLDLPVPDAALSLDDSYLFVQGPPGSGKTWQGAKAAIALIRAGHTIGVTSLSHKAINNLLRAIEHEAERQGFRFRGRKKATVEDDAHRSLNIDTSFDWNDLLDPELQLLAGTAWLFARDELDGRLHTLFVDEAGQVALADAIAGGTSARNLVLLGDPNQLPQVSQGAQPPAARRSVLQHLLGDAQTVPADRGIFLAETWRLRPELCAFTSQAYYEGRLAPAPVCAARSIPGEDGLALIVVEHTGCRQASWEEADAVAAEISRLLGAPFTGADGGNGVLRPEDMLVVAPYNAQVRHLRQRLPGEVRVGTVDKFQGQEAPVVLVSFASSSGEEAPRGIAFAFDRNRVNVATSRGQCRVVVVCAPRLLEADCATVEQMRLVNAVCRFSELARRS